VNRVLLILFAVLFTMSIVVIGCEPAVDDEPDEALENDEPEETIEISLGHMYAPAHPLHEQVFEVWAEELETRTDGRVEVTIHPGASLAGPREIYDAVADGIMDIGHSAATYHEHRLPMTNTICQPTLAYTSTISSNVLWDIYEEFTEYFEEEFNDVKLLWLHTNPPTHLHFKGEEVQTLEDLEGLVVSVGDGTTERMMSRLGVATELIPMAEVYTALDTGVVDGCTLPYAPLRPQGIADLVDHHTEVYLANHSFFAVMNLDTWNNLPSEVQDTIEEISGRWAANLTGEVFDKNVVIDKEWMEEEGHTFYRVPPDEMERWEALIEPIVDAWVSQLEDQGLPGEEVVREIRRLTEEYQN